MDVCGQPFHALRAQQGRHGERSLAPVAVALVLHADDPRDLGLQSVDDRAVQRGLHGADELVVRHPAQHPVQPPAGAVRGPSDRLPAVPGFELFQGGG